MCRNDFRVPIASHSRPWEILDYSPIPIYSQKVIHISSHSHWNKKFQKVL